jgi:uncharacterized membrane protein YfcA
MVPESLVLVALIVFLGAMIQGMMGFGMALVAMPLMVTVLGIQVASPSFALMGLVATFLNTVRWRHDITWRDIRVLLVPALIGVPLGVLFLSRGDPVLVTRMLGVVLIIYAIYSLLGRTLPVGRSPLWGYIAGFFSGALTGAFNAGGPPVVAYASALNWSPDRFKGNMAIFFFIMGLAVVASHAVSGSLTAEVWRIALLALPGLYLGQVTGVFLGRRISPARFSQLVLVLLVVLGIQLLV